MENGNRNASSSIPHNMSIIYLYWDCEIGVCFWLPFDGWHTLVFIDSLEQEGARVGHGHIQRWTVLCPYILVGLVKGFSCSNVNAAGNQVRNPGMPGPWKTLTYLT
jgi:hypothetical protein